LKAVTNNFRNLIPILSFINLFLWDLLRSGVVDKLCIEAGSAYAPKMCSSKIPKNDLHLRKFAVKTKMDNCQQTWIKQLSGEAKRFRVSLKASRKNKGNRPMPPTFHSTELIEF
jgi:hypothetical protein